MFSVENYWKKNNKFYELSGEVYTQIHYYERLDNIYQNGPLLDVKQERIARLEIRKMYMKGNKDKAFKLMEDQKLQLTQKIKNIEKQYSPPKRSILQYIIYHNTINQKIKFLKDNLREWDYKEHKIDDSSEMSYFCQKIFDFGASQNICYELLQRVDKQINPIYLEVKEEEIRIENEENTKAEKERIAKILSGEIEEQAEEQKAGLIAQERFKIILSKISPADKKKLLSSYKSIETGDLISNSLELLEVLGQNSDTLLYERNQIYKYSEGTDQKILLVNFLQKLDIEVTKLKEANK